MLCLDIHHDLQPTAMSTCPIPPTRKPDAYEAGPRPWPAAVLNRAWKRGPGALTEAADLSFETLTCCVWGEANACPSKPLNCHFSYLVMTRPHRRIMLLLFKVLPVKALGIRERGEDCFEKLASYGQRRAHHHLRRPGRVRVGRPRMIRRSKGLCPVRGVEPGGQLDFPNLRSGTGN
jgi:hypothetical protein